MAIVNKNLTLNENERKVLKKLGVAVVYLFGSRAQGISRKGSDYDFGILLSDPQVIKKGTQKIYQALYDIFSDVVSELANIDIIFLDRASLQLCYHVVQYGRVIFETDQLIRARFRERVIREHADFETHRKLFESTILKRIA